MNFKKSVFRNFVSVMLSFSLLFGLSFPVNAKGQAQESTQYIQYNSATKELIEKTISELSAKGEVYRPETDKALDLKVKETSGLSLGAVKTSILFDLFSNHEEGRIDTAKFGLDAATLEKVLNMTLKEFALDSAVDKVEIESDNGIAVGIEFEMRSSFKGGLDELSTVSSGVPEALDSGGNKDIAAIGDTSPDERGGTDTATVTVTETSGDDAGYMAEFNWSYRYVADATNEVGLVYRDSSIQVAPQDELGYFLTKVEFYLESITLTPVQPGGEPVPDTEPVILAASGGEVLTEGNITTITYPNGLKVEDLFVDEAYLGSLQAKLEEELATGGFTPYAQQLMDQLSALGPCIYSHVLTASYTAPEQYPSFDEARNDVYTETINATEQAVYQYYAEMCDFNGAFPQHFGTSANFWTSKDSSSSGTPILGALKTLIGMQPDTFIPFGAYDANGDGELDLQAEMGLDFLISMLTQAFMAYEQQLGGLLDGKIADCRAQISENMTTEQKLLAIHDWLANNAEFDIGLITAMKDGSSGGSDPAQMTAFGTLLYDTLRMDGAICLGYAATYYLLLQEVMGLDTDESDIVMVRWWADIAETSVAGPESGFGQGRFNETHYFNAVKLEDEWYYIDACYDDIYCEVMTQYRVETDGNISHNFFLFAPTNALNMFDGHIDYIDSAYDGVTFQRRLDLDDQGQVQYRNMSPLYETDTDEDGNEHVIWYHSAYPEAAQDAEDAANSYLDPSIACSETPYSDKQYEKSWFTAARGEIHSDGTYYYYVAGELNSYAAMTGEDFGEGDYDIDVNIGEIFKSDDPLSRDRLVRRRMDAPVNATQDSENESSWSRQVEIEFTINGDTMTGNRDVFVDPYTETIFHYGFGTLGQPRLDSDKKAPLLDEDGNYINDKTEAPLPAVYADIVEYDAECMDIYPDLAHTSGMHDGDLYFNIANQIYSLSIADISDWEYTMALLKEYNTVSYVSDGKDFGNEAGSRFTGKTFHLTQDQDQAIGTMTGKPIAAISLEDRWEVTQEGINHNPTLTVSLGTNLTETTRDSDGKGYRVEAVNYNPYYITGYSDADENSNVEFMWCANLVENLLMSDIEADLAAGAEGAGEVTVAPFCVTDGFTEMRALNTGLSIPGTRVVEEGSALGHDFEWNDAEGQHICNRCGAVAEEGSVFTPRITNLTGVSYTNQDSITVEGTVGAEGIVNVYLNGEKAVSVESKDLAFTAELVLTQDINTVMVTADLDGAETEPTPEVTVIRDKVLPVLEVITPVDGQNVDVEQVQVTGTVQDEYLDEVTVNGIAAAVDEAGSFTENVMVSPGENSITVEALDLAGNLVTETRTVQVGLEGPAITDMTPAEDIEVEAGDTVILSFRSETKDADAFFNLTLPTQLEDIVQTPMTEVTPGYYEGKWTVPEGQAFRDARVGYILEDSLGNRVEAIAPGTISVVITGEVTRLAGSNRIHTAIEVSKAGFASADTVILVNGYNFPDALAGAPLAEVCNAPILLIQAGEVHADVLAEIQRLGAEKVVLLGGEIVIAPAVEEQLAEYTVERIAGSNRFETAALIGELVAEDSGSRTAILVNGYEFPDGLSVGPAASIAGSPVLFTSQSRLNATTLDALNALGIEKVTIVGGPVAVSENVQEELETEGFTVDRIQGANRYETALQVAEAMFGVPDQVVIASGENFPDALAAGPLATSRHAPLLLVQKDRVRQDVLDYLTEHGVKKVFLLGGDTVISDAVFQAIEDAKN